MRMEEREILKDKLLFLRKDTVEESRMGTFQIYSLYFGIILTFKLMFIIKMEIIIMTLGIP